MEDFYNDYIEGLSKIAFNEKLQGNLSPTWDEMESRLDKEMPQKRKKRIIIFFWFLLASLLTGTGFYFINSMSKNAETTAVAQKNNKQITTLSTNEITKSTTSILENKTTLHNNKIETQQPTNKPIIITKNENKNSIAIKLNQNNHIQETSKLKSLNNLKKEFAKKENKATKDNSTKQTVPTNIQQNETALTTSKLKTETHENQSSKAIQPITTTDSNKTTTTITSAKDTTVKQNITKQETPKKIKNKLAKWELSTTFAPDFLVANINTLHKPGISFGVGIDYVFNAHFRVRTGLLYNHNTVNINGNDYDYIPSKNLPTYTTLQLNNVMGYIDVLEVPLALRYTFNPSKKITFNISTGLSSIFFLNKNYTYDLLLNSTTQLNWNSHNDTDDNGNPHILNNLVIGTGIGFKIKKKFYLEVEPTFKLPLEELNEGHKKVGSFLINFTLRHPL